ncbi:uncharacterized protein BJ171DRAFT_438485 [Polychytrium aggregatum]|uniref:uncharacterized protein n=1 Tax=Polychytrium aggregatum TaxID=110093 RepID=UPI0022FEA415|nr:uncharacterized protein BJ171DRAFT_438485 [Polychytrium aggregatum]KAI9208191.1 hypothetical protein BJ171DRAFT_438485 [Polychytrium aggregatum]
MPPAAPWQVESLNGDDSVSKKDIATFLQTHATAQFLKDRKLHGKLANVTKASKREELVAAYSALFELEAFRPDGQPLEEALAEITDAPAVPETTKTEKKKITEAVEPPRYTKTILSKGDGERYPRKGQNVGCFYTGFLPDGSVFDTNIPKGKKKPVQLRFKVGNGRVIRGWDEALMTMSCGEKARLVIESDWAYGKKGNPEAGIPPNTPLTFEVELVSID